MEIDITYDMRTDSNGYDPDSHSKTLRAYHKQLWSKTLPNGKEFSLTDSRRGAYLYHKSDLGEYFLKSDGFIPTYSRWHRRRAKELIEQIPQDEIDGFNYIAYTIGGIIIFPGKQINKRFTMNQARGTNRYINDRMDITLECIRRYYNGEDSKLFEAIKRYAAFFALFGDFKGYCEYFLLQDLVTEDFAKVKFFLPFNEFIYDVLPKDVEEYNTYKKNSIEFLNNRNNRIAEYSKM